MANNHREADIPRSDEPAIEVAQDDLKRIYGLVRQVLSRKPSRELQRALDVLEPYLPDTDDAESTPGRCCDLV